MNNTASQTIFTTQDVVILTKETVYQGYFRIEKFNLKHRLFAGGWSQPFIREIFERGHAAGALPYDPVLQKIVLIEQFRVGTLGQTETPWLLELVAGIIEPGETAAAVARRETQEEAGLIASDLLPICDYWVSPGGTSEKVSLFCARVDAKNAGGIHGLLEEHEDIRVHAFDTEEVYRMLGQGRICNAATIIAVQWLQLHETDVRNTWLKN